MNAFAPKKKTDMFLCRRYAIKHRFITHDVMKKMKKKKNKTDLISRNYEEYQIKMLICV